jgi:hypothetical protein
MASERKPAADRADPLSEWFCLAAETTQEDSQQSVQNQARDLRPSEVPAARLAHALNQAYPRLRTIEIAERLARDHGYYDGRWKPYRCKRLRQMIVSYGRCVDAGVEPAPETIFGD